MAGSVSLRPVTAEDEAFLLALYATTREQELAMTDWGPAEQAQFVQMQFQAQQHHYQRAFPQARHEIILYDGMAVGRIYVDRPGSEIRLIDITITPSFRSQGIGGHLLEQLKAEATAADIPVRFYVWQFNMAAQKFYQRHGFEQIGTEGAYVFMGWYPGRENHHEEVA